MHSRLKFRPPCGTCKSSWQYPRTYDHEVLPGMTHKISPTTHETVTIAPSNVGQELVTHLSYTWRRGFGKLEHSGLIDGFEYDGATGEIFFDGERPAESGKQLNYARLVTLNNWWMDLAVTGLFMGMSTMDLQANALLFIEIALDSGHQDFFVINITCMSIWLAFVVVSLAIATYEASFEWAIKSSVSVGDIITEVYWLDRALSFASLVLLRFYFVTGTVKDVVIQMHPWKSIQPYAALKLEGTRACLIGFQSKRAFVVEDRSGQQLGMPLQFIARGAGLVFRLWLAWETPQDRWSLFAGSLPAIATTVWLSIKLKNIRSYRNAAYEPLIDILSQPDADPNKKEHAQKQLLMHWHRAPDDDGNIKLRFSGLGEIVKKKENKLHPECQVCGQPVEEDDDDDVKHETGNNRFVGALAGCTVVTGAGCAALARVVPNG